MPCTGEQPEDNDRKELRAGPVRPKPKRKRNKLADTDFRAELQETLKLYRVSPADAAAASADLITPEHSVIR